MRSAVLLFVLAFAAAACSSSQSGETISLPSTVASTAGSSSTPTTTTTGSVVTTVAEVAPTTTTTTLPGLQGLAYERVVDGLEFPIMLTSPPGDDRLFVALKDGRIVIVAGGEVVVPPLLDIRDLVRDDDEQGLLGLAFAPDFGASGRFFVHYSAINGDTTVSEFVAEPGSETADPDRERVVLSLDQPARNHNGGMIQFGPDGFLYVGLGDGGGADDQFGDGQRPDTLLGTILRIDVDGDVDAGEDGRGFTVPPDNPFVEGGGDPAVWAYGLRNPWRFWIDEVDGSMYIGDVGQDGFEEIDVVSLDPVGYNFGWPITEGLHCFLPRSGCDVEGLTLPLVEEPLGVAGACAITGGVTYRGGAIPELVGHYFYSDFCAGYLKSFRAVDGEATEQTDWTDQVGEQRLVASFGVDADGEVYVISANGAIFQIVPVR